MTHASNNLLALADYIEGNDRVLFNMDILLQSADALGLTKDEVLELYGDHDTVPHFCGSIGCLAGFKWLMDKGEVGYHCYVDDYAQGALGLNAKQADWLFYPKIKYEGEDKSLSFTPITRAQAIRVLREFAATLLTNPHALPDWTEVAEENGDI